MIADGNGGISHIRSDAAGSATHLSRVSFVHHEGRVDGAISSRRKQSPFMNHRQMPMKENSNQDGERCGDTGKGSHIARARQEYERSLAFCTACMV